MEEIDKYNSEELNTEKAENIAIGNEKSLNREIGLRIQKVRVSQGLTLVELAARAKLSRMYLYGIERNRHPKVSAAALKSICDALGVKMDDLLDGIDIDLEQSLEDMFITKCARFGYTKEEASTFFNITVGGKHFTSVADALFAAESVYRAMRR